MNEVGEVVRELGKRIAPLMSEFGIEGCVLVGYVRLEPGLQRFLAVNVPKGDAAQADGLRPVVHFGTMWAAPDIADKLNRPQNPEGG